MAIADVNGLSLAYEVIGERVAPGSSRRAGASPRSRPACASSRVALAEHGNKVLIWDRPNCGESDVCFEGPSESAMQADALAGLLGHLDMTPAVIAGGSGGARVSLLTAARHPEAAAGLAIWWISGGVYGLLTLAMHYCGGSLAAAWKDGMEAVADLPEWAEVLERNPSNRDRFLAQDPAEFVATMERWMLAYCPRDDEHVPGLPDAEARTLEHPGARLPQWRQRRRTTPGPPPNCSPDCCRRPASPSRPGATASGSSARRHATRGSSPTGRVWPRSCWSGRPKFCG